MKNIIIVYMLKYISKQVYKTNSFKLKKKKKKRNQYTSIQPHRKIIPTKIFKDFL